LADCAGTGEIPIVATAFAGDEAEISMGSFDPVGLFTPQYESWCTRREPWQIPLAVPQYDADKPPTN
jgi:hypothetical protein